MGYVHSVYGAHNTRAANKIWVELACVKMGGGGIGLKSWVKPGCSPQSTQMVPKWPLARRLARTNFGSRHVRPGAQKWSCFLDLLRVTSRMLCKTMALPATALFPGRGSAGPPKAQAGGKGTGQRQRQRQRQNTRANPRHQRTLISPFQPAGVPTDAPSLSHNFVLLLLPSLGPPGRSLCAMTAELSDLPWHRAEGRGYQAQRPQRNAGAQGVGCPGGQLQAALMRQPPSYLPKLARGGGGGRREGGGGGYWQLGQGGGLRVTHYYHMHTSRVCVCVSGGMRV